MVWGSVWLVVECGVVGRDVEACARCEVVECWDGRSGRWLVKGCNKLGEVTLVELPLNCGLTEGFDVGVGSDVGGVVG